MSNTEGSARSRIWLDIVFVYAIWFLLIALCTLAFFLCRTALKEVIALISGGRQLSDAFYLQSGTLVVGLLAFVFVMGAEPYLRSAPDRRQTVRRFVRLVVPLAIIIVVVAALLTLIPFLA
jgi:small-conductance mechanosensitive channel